MGTKIIECKQCKKLFQSFGSKVCPNCTEQLEKDFETVKEYLYNNPGANLVDVTEATGVSEKTVLYYMREGRLAIEGADSSLTCEKCKKPISCGRFCKQCQAELESTLYKSYVQSKQELADEAKKALLGRIHVDFRNN
jgi:uncharacterized protein